MNYSSSPSDGRELSGAAALSDEVARLSDTIAACDRLCLLSARTVEACAIDTADGFTFVPSISRDQHNRDEKAHPSTTAQCIAALQHLLPVVGRFQLGTAESKDLPFHPIDRTSLAAFEPGQVSNDLRNIIRKGLDAIKSSTSAGPGSADETKIRSRLTSETFGYAHPFTAAQILRAITPSHGIFEPLWWRSLFIVLWFLNRRGGSLRGFANIQATQSPGTAFLTSKCVDALETLLGVFGRRRNRFKKLIDTMEAFRDVGTIRQGIVQLHKQNLISENTFQAGLQFREQLLALDILQCINELALDSGLPKTYDAWNKAYDKFRHKGGDQCDHVIGGFCNAMQQAEVKREHDTVRKTVGVSVEKICKIDEVVVLIHDALSGKLDRTMSAFELESCRANTLPEWICSADYWLSTGREVVTIATDDSRKQLLEALEVHWRRHRDASTAATRMTKMFKDYLDTILEVFDTVDKSVRDQYREMEKLKRSPSGAAAAAEHLAEIRQDMLKRFLDGFNAATKHIADLRRGMSRDVEIGVRWAEDLMNRHLSHAASDSTSEFDPSELAHALRVVCVGDRKVRFDLILTALNAICAAQRSDGSWECRQPFYWTKSGSTVSTLSIETASAIVATVIALQQNPERYGASPEQCLAKLQGVFRALDRYFQWLSANMQSFPVPPALQSPNNNTQTLYGWCSDRAPEHGRIHSWVTAAAIEFLVEFRQLQQDRINALLRAAFLSHHPGELKTLADVAPTDLDREERAILLVAKELREHKWLELREGPWLPGMPRKPEISLWSAMFYGPPGTSKTFLAEAIAGELGWPLISLSPSDFLSAGGQHIEARAKEIFSALSAGSRLVYFFDEVDELIRDRRHSQREQQSVFSFLTPSFLTKLQDLRKAAKKKEFIFILGTNYFDRIDSAAKRTGRIDREFALVYPDLKSRQELMLQYMIEKIGPRKGEPVTKAHLDRLSNVCAKLQAAWKRSAPVKAARSQPHSGDKPFVEILSDFTGFLAYTKMRELLDARLRLLLDEADNVDTFDMLVNDLREVTHGESIRFKPEINLSDYSDRPDALEEIKLVLGVFPKGTSPWSPLRAKNERRRVQLTSLIGRVSNPTFEAALKKELARKDS